MKKYPNLSPQSIKKCISKIDKSKFDTYEFIDTWGKLFPDELTLFSGIGIGWKKVIGRELSLFSQTNAELKKSKNRSPNAQIWLKN